VIVIMTINRTPFLVLAVAAPTAVAAACSSASPATRAPGSPPSASGGVTTPSTSPSGVPASGSTVSLPSTPAGTQARWLFGAMARPPIPTAQIDAHFDQTALRQVTPAQLNSVLDQARSVQVDAITTSTADTLVMTVTANAKTTYTVTLGVDSAGLIRELVLQPAGTTAAMPPTPTSWSAVGQQVQSVAPQTEMLVAKVSHGSCQPVRAVNAQTPAPLGSAFKLYVLDALARAVARGQVSWNQQLTVTSQLKSLPSGSLQDDPDGTRVTVQQATDDMISQSDNTATNLLLALVGRTAVEQAAAETGLANPSLDEPFLNTRELFVLKLVDWPTLANRYLAASTAGKRALLASTIDKVPYRTLTAASSAAWTTPRDISSLEWFASPADICRVYASLATLAGQPGLAPVGRALSISDAGLNLDRSQWKSVWFKGGNEPGVLTLNYLATTTSGQSYLVSVLAANPKVAFDQNQGALTLLSAVKGAFELAAR
jgi:beta-lactamase class A